MKTVLITGGSGFLGKQLALLLKDRYRVVLGARNNGNNQKAQTLTGCEAIPLDIASRYSVRDALKEFKPQLVIHAAATKFVDLSEKYPMECIDVNIKGSQYVVRECIDAGVETLIGVSTDKAAPPVGNIYGHSKAVMERLFCNMNGKTDTKIACVRFGNIAWSTGSVLPIWENMMATKGVIESTGPHMRRFFFTVEEAAELTIRAMEHIEVTEGKILSLKMKAAQVSELLDVWTKNMGGSWNQIASRPGDKLDEHLVGGLELEHTEEITLEGAPHYLLHMHHKPQNAVTDEVSSANAPRLSEAEILAILKGKPAFA